MSGTRSFDALEDDASASGSDKADHHAGDGGLAAAALPDQAQCLARVEIEADAAHGLQPRAGPAPEQAAAGLEGFGQVPDL